MTDVPGGGLANTLPIFQCTQNIDSSTAAVTNSGIDDVARPIVDDGPVGELVLPAGGEDAGGDGDRDGDDERQQRELAGPEQRREDDRR